MNKRINQKWKGEAVLKSLLVLLCFVMLFSLSSCSSEQSPELEIQNHSLNSVDDAYPYIYNLGEEIPGYTKESEKINNFTITLYRSIYEYDTMHPRVILFIEQPKDQTPCAYGIRFDTAEGTLNFGFSASPWHCVLVNTPKPAEITCSMYLYGEEGETILEEIFTNNREDKMEEYATQFISYSLHILSDKTDE